MTTDLRTLLTEVAAGRIDPGRAAEMLDDLPAEDSGPADRAVPEDSAPAGDQASARREPASTTAQAPPVERIQVTASARPVRIIGDSTVATVTVDGPHTVTADGTVLRIDARAAGAATPAAPGSYAYERKTGLSRWLAHAGTVGVPVTVRMNPTLAAQAEVLAGSLEIAGLSGPVVFSLTAGSLRMHDCSGVVNGVVRAGSAVLQVRPTAGASSVRVESGSLDLRLLPGSDVRLSGQADLGEFKVRGADGSLTLSKVDRLPEQVVGAGNATFELHVSMGSAKVRLP
jgi:hypothetical protein